MQNKRQIKIIALSLFIAFFIFFALISDGVTKTVSAFSGQLQSGNTGAPGEPTCATGGCHTGAFNTFDNQFTIVISKDGEVITRGQRYALNADYDITVSANNTNTNRQSWGFQLTVLGEAASGAGTLTPMEGSTTLSNSSGPTQNRQYIQHVRRSTDEMTWTFKWKAPSSSVGDVTFYLAGVQGNGKESDTGQVTSSNDQVFTTFFNLAASDSSSSPQPVISEVIKETETVDGVEVISLIVKGRNFDEGSKINIDGVTYKKTIFVSPEMLKGVKKLIKKAKAGKTITVRNSAGRESEVFKYCTYSISATSQSFSSEGGTGSVEVTTVEGCSWTATSNADWLTITSGSSGTGNGAVNFTVAPNESADSRTGTITIAGQTFTITQAGAG